MLGTNAWYLVRPIVDLVADLGFDRPRALRRLGIAPGADPSEIRIPIDRVLALWADAIHELGDPSLPLRVGHSLRLEHLQLTGFAIMTAPTGHEALARALRYAPLITDSGRWCGEETGDRITIRWVREGERWLGHRVANEAGLAQFVSCLRQLCGPRFAPAGVHFRHAAPPSIAHLRAFFRCPLSFGEAEDLFWFDRRALDVTPPAANPGLATFICDQADARLRTFRGSIVARTCEAIDRALRGGDRPTAEAAALALGTSERSLRRHLAHAGASFSDLVDETLRARAHTLVAETARPLTEIAIDLGFSDASAFSHAFKRWHGCAPRELRSRRGAT